jgi:hypothetical protein
MRAGGCAEIARQAGVDISHVIDYAGVQSGRLPQIGKNLGEAQVKQAAG